MVKGKCIYCKEDKVLNKEHAFLKSLLHKCVPLGKSAPEWIIERLCEDCNNNRLGKLDKILATKSAMAFIWRVIKNEWKPEVKSQDSAFYNAKAHGMYPVRLFSPNPLYGNLIVLHQETGTSTSSFYPTPLVCAQAPQIILTQYAEGQTKEEVIAENSEKWDAGEFPITESDEHGVYCIFGNTYIFPPKATKYFVSNPNREQEFKSKFLKKRDNIRYDLNTVFPDDSKDYGTLKGFYNRLKASTKELIEWENFEPKDFTQEIMIVADLKAVPSFDRAVAKIAFHCFLYHYRQFSGHEPIFDDIKAFIEGKEDSHGETSKELISGVAGTENYVWDSNEHFHILRFYVNGDNIVCQIAFFTGLLVGPFASGITLAGDFDKAMQGSCKEVSIPFYVHAKSQLMRRIVPVSFDRENHATLQDMEPAEDTPLASDQETAESLESKSPRKNPSAQRLIKAMAQPPHITDEDIEELLKVIKEAKQPTRFESPFDDIEEIEDSE